MCDANLCLGSGLVPAAVNHEAARQERDAAADLAMCEAAIEGPFSLTAIGNFIAESREALPYWIRRCVAAEGKPSFEDIVRGLSPRVISDFTVHQASGGRTRAEAEEIAATVIANLPEAHWEERHGNTYNCKWLHVESGPEFNNRVVDIFFTEEAPHV